MPAAGMRTSSSRIVVSGSLRWPPACRGVPPRSRSRSRPRRRRLRRLPPVVVRALVGLPGHPGSGCPAGGPGPGSGPAVAVLAGLLVLVLAVLLAASWLPPCWRSWLRSWLRSWRSAVLLAPRSCRRLALAAVAGLLAPRLPGSLGAAAVVAAPVEVSRLAGRRLLRRGCGSAGGRPLLRLAPSARSSAAPAAGRCRRRTGRP